MVTYRVCTMAMLLATHLHMAIWSSSTKSSDIQATRALTLGLTTKTWGSVGLFDCCCRDEIFLQVKVVRIALVRKSEIESLCVYIGVLWLYCLNLQNHL